MRPLNWTTILQRSVDEDREIVLRLLEREGKDAGWVRLKILLVEVVIGSNDGAQEVAHRFGRLLGYATREGMVSQNQVRKFIFKTLKDVASRQMVYHHFIKIKNEEAEQCPIRNS